MTQRFQLRHVVFVSSAILLWGCPGDDTSLTTATTATTENMTDTTNGVTTNTLPTITDTETPTSGSSGNPTTTGVDTGSSSDSADSGSTSMSTTGSGSDSGSDSGSSSGSESGSESSSGGMDCADEDLGNVVPQMVMGDNTGTGDDVMPSCATGGEDYIYTFTAPNDGWFRFDTIGSGFDTTLSILDGCGGMELLCNDNAEGGTDSVLEVELQTGQTVVLAVEGAAGEVGSFNLNVDEIVFMDPPADYCLGLFEGPSACMMPGSSTLPQGGTVTCDDSGFFYFDIYEVPVSMGDCVWISVDNIDPILGASGLEAGDMVVVTRDAMGTNVVLDDEVPCTDMVFGGFSCPEGEVTPAADGTLSIGVSQYGGMGCPDPTPYTLNVSINGVDYDLSGMAPAHNDGSADCG